MASVNKVILVGNMGRDPELKHFNDGTAVCNVSIATTEKWKDKNSGEMKEATEWHTLVFTGRPAEVVAQYCQKGTSLYVEGSLKTRKWQDKDTGADRYTTEVKVRDFQILAGGRGRDGQAAPAQQQQRPQAQAQRPAAVPADMDDDIPF